jgi:hypothetical protein
MPVAARALLKNSSNRYPAEGGCVNVNVSSLVRLVLLVACVFIPRAALAQAGAQASQPQDAVEDFVERFGIGVQGGVGLDPELIVFGAHGTFAPIFHPQVEFRPGVDFGVGEVTTSFGINLDVLYRLPGSTGRWRPYFGAGPNFALSHQSFDLDDDDLDDDDLDDDDIDDPSRFDFSDTDFKTGFNFIAGARSRGGMFVEMKGTAYGVTNIRLLAGFNF